MSKSILQRFLRDRRGNVAMTFGLTLIPLFFAIGMAVNYSVANKLRTKLNALADSSALVALTPAMLGQSDTTANTAAQNFFNAQAAGLSGLNYATSNLQVTVATVNGTRTVTVSYTATSNNIMPGLLGMGRTLAISGTTTASSSALPNIDFYMVLDNSPSMAIGATQADINTMVANTPDQCGFACHESDTSPNDYYGLARSLGVTIRMDLVRQAVQSLTSTAKTMAASNGTQYRMAVYTFNTAFNTIATLSSNLTNVQTQAGNIDIYQVPYQNWNNDAITNYDNAMTSINGIMPNPGNGTNNSGDKPQEVMFFVTDGVEDETVAGNRQQSLMDNGWCTTIKNRGVRIAVLYTTYLPLPTNAWYNTYIAPFQSSIGSTLQSCASPNLYFEVQVGGDITAAMNTLFQSAVKTAHITH